MDLFTAAKPHIPSPFKAGRHAKASKEYAEGVPMEPCSTLQVAADDIVLVFDLLALAPKKALTSRRLLSQLLSPFFRDGIIKLGFGLQ